jgi:hypothetical protein
MELSPILVAGENGQRHTARADRTRLEKGQQTGPRLGSSSQGSRLNADASDLVAEKQHLIGEPHYELVVGGIVFRHEHRLSFLATEFGDHRQRAITLLARSLFTKFYQVKFDCHGSLYQREREPSTAHARAAL